MENERRVGQRRQVIEPIGHPERRSGGERRVFSGGTATGAAVDRLGGVDIERIAAAQQRSETEPLNSDGPHSDGPQEPPKSGGPQTDVLSAPQGESEAKAPTGEAPKAAKFPMMGRHDAAIETAGTKAFVERRRLKRRSTDTW